MSLPPDYHMHTPLCRHAVGEPTELAAQAAKLGFKEIYPIPRIVQLAAQLGVPISFASDSHAPNEVGMNSAEAVKLARDAGYTQCPRFTRRNREEVKI